MKALIAVVVMASLIATPAAAAPVRDAAFASSSDHSNAKTSMFAGASYRIGLDRRSGGQRGRASLKLAGMTHAPGSTSVRFGDGLEIAGGRSGKPALFLAGQDVGQFNQKANMSSGAKTALIIVAVTAVVGGAIFAAVLIEASRCTECE